MTTPDFSQLYTRLDLQPDCSLDDLKRAYRKCIWEMHPDRQGIESARQDFGISDLNSLYAQALRFYKQHGRLPGSKPQASMQNRAPFSVRNTRALDTEKPAPSKDSQASPRKGLIIGLVVVVLLASALAMSLDPLSSEAGHETGYWSSPAEPTNPLEARESRRLEVGMDTVTVLALQGDPINMRGDEWDYGPSWVRFEEGRLVEWYSSPLRQLRVDTPSAPAKDK